VDLAKGEHDAVSAVAIGCRRNDGLLPQDFTDDRIGPRVLTNACGAASRPRKHDAPRNTAMTRLWANGQDVGQRLEWSSANPGSE
jgi:hypothetical protein